jgi:tRNA dimethylallyltransferase
VVGPTAVGKSDLALLLAEDLAGEIVSLDSRQMVRGLDIGTAKPTAVERARVPHHLVDITTPDRPLALPDVLGLVDAAVTDITARGRRPILVGGTGQYVRALREGWQVPPVPPDPALRSELAAFAAAAGPAALHERLATLDPAAAGRIDARNVRRVTRAIEVAMAGSRDQAEQPAPTRALGARFDLLVVGLSRPRPELYARIDARIDVMLAAGLADEVRGLVEAGYDWRLPAMSSVGYGEWRGYFEGDVDEGEVLRLIRHNTRRLVRNQAAWFRADDPGIRWFEMAAPDAAIAILDTVQAWWAAEPDRDIPSDGADWAAAGIITG